MMVKIESLLRWFLLLVFAFLVFCVVSYFSTNNSIAQDNIDDNSTVNTKDNNGNRDEKIAMLKIHEDSNFVYTAETEIDGYTLIGAQWVFPEGAGRGQDNIMFNELPATSVKISTSVCLDNNQWSSPESAQDDLSAHDGASDPILLNQFGVVRLVLESEVDLGDNIQMSVISQMTTSKDEEVINSGGDIQLSDIDSISSVELSGLDTNTSNSSLGTLAVGSRPAIHSRAEWGGDDAYSAANWPVEYTTYNGAVVHHTAGSNNYEPQDVPGILRSIYLYHAVTLGWGDIGYNFLVDKYGGIWEGRMGGVTNAVVAGHAKHNANYTTFGVSVLGNYEEVQPTNESIQALINIIHWKFAVHGINPQGTGWIGDEWGYSTKPTIVGHKDVGNTACPGRFLYPYLDSIRKAGFLPEGAIDSVSSDSNGNITVKGWAIDRDDSTKSIDVHLYIGGPAGKSGVKVVSFSANQPRPDVTAHFGLPAGNHGFSYTFNTQERGIDIPLYFYGINIGSGSNNLFGTKSVTIIDASGRIPVYRAAKYQGGYFYTSNRSEYNTVEQYAMRPEGLAFYTVPQGTPGSVEVYRSAKLNGAGYFYTTSKAEWDITPLNNMRKEGVAFYAFPAGSKVLPNLKPALRGAQVINQGYIYTTSQDEYYRIMPPLKYRLEGEAFRVL
jgi:hypothetical protein